MSFKNVICIVVVLVLVVLTGCQQGGLESNSIADHFSASGRASVDLAAAVPGRWDRVCILGPYSSDDDAAETLGFKWHAETLTSIEYNDRISLLMFLQGESVVSYVEHPRTSGDFSNLSGRCFSHQLADFIQINDPTQGWPGLYPSET